MSLDLYGYECGVLLDKDHPEFEFYSNNNPALPYGFYDEDQGIFGKGDVELHRCSLREYVQNGVENTYAIISYQGTCSESDFKKVMEDGDVSGWMGYSFFRNKDEVVYSVCKRDGKLVEGFLEDLIDLQLVRPETGKVQQAKDIDLLTDDEKIDIAARSIMDRFKPAFLELAKPAGESGSRKVPLHTQISSASSRAETSNISEGSHGQHHSTQR